MTELDRESNWRLVSSHNPRNRGSVGSMWQRIKRWGGKTDTILTETIFSRTNYEEYLVVDFDKAKRASDFVSIHINAAFLMFCFKYFWAKSKITGGIDSICLSSAGAVAFAGFIYLMAKICLVISSFLLDDLQYRKT